MFASQCSVGFAGEEDREAIFGRVYKLNSPKSRASAFRL